MLDQPIDVLDSYIRFVDFARAASVLDHVGTAEVPAEVAARGPLSANLWRCGWQLEVVEPGELFRLHFTPGPQAPWKTTFDAIRTVAYFVEESSFMLLRGAWATEYLRFWKKRVDFERGRLAFVPESRIGVVAGHVVVALHDWDLSSIHADRLAHELVVPVLDTGIEQFEIRAELISRGPRYVRAAGRAERPR